MHLRTRGTAIEPRGELARVPVGSLPSYFAFPQADVAHSPACEAAEVLQQIGPDVSPFDPRWEGVRALLASMRDSPRPDPEGQAFLAHQVPAWVDKHKHRRRRGR